MTTTRACRLARIANDLELLASASRRRITTALRDEAMAAAAELERRAAAVFAQLRPSLVAILRELAAAGQTDAQILGRSAINAVLEWATLTRALIESALPQIRAGELWEGA